MRLLGWILMCFVLTAPAKGNSKNADDAQLKLQPVSLNPILLTYDNLSSSTTFCAATPVKQLLAITVNCNGYPTCNNEYTLAGSNGSTIPIALTFTDNHGTNKTLSPNVREEGIPSQGANCGTGDNINTRTLDINVNRDAIDWTKAPFERTFTIIAENIEKNRLDTEEFTIKFGENGFIHISGLKDFSLDYNNNWQASNEYVCIVSSMPSYRLTATSANNGMLENNAYDIPYSLQYQKSDNTVWLDLDFGSTYSNLLPSNTESCTDGTFLGVRVNVQDSNIATKPPGNYTDTVTVIVEGG